MSTLKQKIAARAKGAKIERPRHAMLATTFVFDEEHKDRFRDLVDSLYDEHQPTTETERALVETMAISRWRQMRLWGLEKTILTQEMDSNDESADPTADPLTLPERAAQAIRTLAASGNGLQLILRYEAQSFRTFLRCLKTLNELQEAGPQNKNNDTNPIVHFPEQTEQPTAPKVQPADEAPAPPPAQPLDHTTSALPQTPLFSKNSAQIAPLLSPEPDSGGGM